VNYPALTDEASRFKAPPCPKGGGLHRPNRPSPEDAHDVAHTGSPWGGGAPHGPLLQPGRLGGLTPSVTIIGMHYRG